MLVTRICVCVYVRMRKKEDGTVLVCVCPKKPNRLFTDFEIKNSTFHVGLFCIGTIHNMLQGLT